MSPSNLSSPRQVSQDEALLRSSRRTTKTSSPPAPVSLNVTGRISMGPPPRKRHKAGPAVTATSSHGTSTDKGKQKEAPASQEDHGSVGFPPSTSAALHLPDSDTITSHLLRPRPPITRYAQGPPLSKPNVVKLLHPANGLVFLTLPAHDRLPGPELQFGLHHEMVITACMIVACNCRGYLSKSRKRDVDRVDLPLDSVILSDKYYYHLDDDSKTGKLYPICRDFRNWRFPHGEIPQSWLGAPAVTDRPWPTNWTALSEKVKARDTVCLVSGYTQALTTAHVVNKEDNDWARRIRSSRP
jgi:hypothetical protein